MVTKYKPINSGEVLGYLSHKGEQITLSKKYYEFLQNFKFPKTLQEVREELKNIGWSLQDIESIPSIFMELEFQDCIKPIEALIKYENFKPRT